MKGQRTLRLLLPRAFVVYNIFSPHHSLPISRRAAQTEDAGGRWLGLVLMILLARLAVVHGDRAGSIRGGGETWPEGLSGFHGVCEGTGAEGDGGGG